MAGHARHVVYSGARGLALQCVAIYGIRAAVLQEYLPYDVEPDLVVVEYAINDPPYPEPQFLNEPRKR